METETVLHATWIAVAYSYEKRSLPYAPIVRRVSWDLSHNTIYSSSFKGHYKAYTFKNLILNAHKNSFFALFDFLQVLLKPVFLLRIWVTACNVHSVMQIIEELEIFMSEQQTEQDHLSYIVVPMKKENHFNWYPYLNNKKPGNHYPRPVRNTFPNHM